MQYDREKLLMVQRQHLPFMVWIRFSEPLKWSFVLLPPEVETVVLLTTKELILFHLTTGYSDNGFF